MAESNKSQSLSEDLQALLADDKREWVEAIDAIYSEFGEAGVREILRNVQDHVLGRNVALDEATLNTPYINTIAPEDQPIYPGDVEIEERIEKILRWNAIAMVLQAQDKGIGVGGHIATYASCATMLEVGFNHFFRVLGLIMIAALRICCCPSRMLHRGFMRGLFLKAVYLCNNYRIIAKN